MVERLGGARAAKEGEHYEAKTKLKATHRLYPEVGGGTRWQGRTGGAAWIARAERWAGLA
jgi:hypothetical protein